ncbi:MAG: DEAD/DEAH box helicase family protein [Eubacterium sp.]|jgi:hypothetical protein|nr:DEAD/DEAH box helicase family protein [Eubacterium sp.]
MQLYDYQLDAVRRMKNGCILCGGVGSGKSRTALAYYFIKNGGELGDEYYPMSDPPQDLIIITTARKRDTLEWEGECAPFLISPDRSVGLYQHRVIIDSWNNIGKYKDKQNSFFIFDEQRVVGHGEWVKSFLKITKNNDWILLSATPGDSWQDYIPVFIANGFYKNRTQFNSEHIVWDHHVKFPKVDRYINTGRLIRLRNSILVDMDFQRKTTPHHVEIYTDYDPADYKRILRDRWNIWDERPLETGGELCYALRRLVNSDESRSRAVMDILADHPKAIIFYGFDYELNILKHLPYMEGTVVSEWNGHKHQPVPDGDAWAYLVQYTAGCEGWNCIKTDTVIFYSQNYSYKVMEQASGRIDRLNTPFSDLYYYHLKSHASIDVSISRALKAKRDFNIGRFVNTHK